VSSEQESRSFDGIGKLLSNLAVSSPRAAYSMAGKLGALRNRVTRRWPRVDEVQSLFPLLDAHDAANVAARIGALYERNRVLVRSIQRHGIDPVRSFVSASEPLASMKGPRILATFHVGAVNALGPALERFASPVLAFRQGRLFTPRGSLEIQSTEGDEQRRAATLHRALLHLREGGIVVVALDVVPDLGTETQCLGHTLRLAPGAFALARWSGAPIIPITARWTADGVRIDAGEAVSTPDEAATWLERYLLESPSELTLGLLRMLLGVS
jgi:hypothetical protein